jgi:dihydrofolate reductase
MAKLIYSAITSLDGYVADEAGNFDWAEPDEEVHAFVNDLARPVGTYLLGRRMYEVMVYWKTAHTVPDEPPVMRDFAAIWQAADSRANSSAPAHYCESVPSLWRMNTQRQLIGCRQADAG